MNRKYSIIKIRLYISAIVILIFGLIASTWIFLAATDENDMQNVIGYEIVNGHAYPIESTYSKRYQNEEERMGGPFAIVADEITQGFSSLFHGKRLAYTIAVIAICLSLVCYWIAQHPDYQVPENRNDEDI